MNLDGSMACFESRCRAKLEHCTSTVMKLISFLFVYVHNCTLFLSWIEVSCEADYGEVATWFGQVIALL